MLHRAHDLTAVANNRALYVPLGPHKVRRIDIGVGIDPDAAIEIQRRLVLQQLHIGAVIAVDGSNILPVAGKLIGKEPFSRRQHLRNDVLSEVMLRSLVLVIRQQAGAQHRP